MTDGDRVQDRMAKLVEAPAFAGLSRRAVRRIAELATVEDAPGGTVLYQQGERPRFLFLLMHGQVGFSAAGPDGKVAIVDVAAPPAVFPLASCLTNAPLLSLVETLFDARLLRIPAKPLREMLRSDPEIGVAMTVSLSQLSRDLYAAVMNLKIRSAVQRLGSYLVSLAREQGNPRQVQLPISKQFLASRLGTTPENLSRCFAGLRRYGIETTGASVRIADLKRLAAFAALDADNLP